jgi:hypothetical protein
MIEEKQLAPSSQRWADDTEVPKWFAYRQFTFLDGINQPTKTKEWNVISPTVTDFLRLTGDLCGHLEPNNGRHQFKI